MAAYAADVYAWSPSRYALWTQRWGNYYDDQQNYPTAILLRHPTAPYIGEVDEINDDNMQRIAYEYLIAANSLTEPHIDRPLKIPRELLSALAPRPERDLSDARSFRWLPIGWPLQSGNSNHQIPEEPKVQTLVSFQAIRQDVFNGSMMPDLTLVMLATRLDMFEFILPSGFEFGIRIVAHVYREPEGGYKVRITGMSASLPFGAWKNTGGREDSGQNSCPRLVIFSAYCLVRRPGRT